MRKTNFVKIIVLAGLLLGNVAAVQAKTVKIVSPNGGISVDVNADKQVGLSVKQGKTIVANVAQLSLTVDGKALGDNAKLLSVKKAKGDNEIKPTFPLKQAVIRDRYNEATLSFDGGYQIVVRVMDNAVAYRFVVNKNGKIKVGDETAVFQPQGQFTAHVQQAGSFNTSYEEFYVNKPYAEWVAEKQKLATLPALFSAADGSDLQLLFGESDVDDYPRAFFQTSDKGLKIVHPRYPEKWVGNGDRGETIEKEGDYVAAIDGNRELPWRWLIVTDSKGLLEQTVPVQLARRSVLTDTSWIKPGKVSWEWWNGNTPFGPDVTFRAGCNYDTYKYFIDFAAKFGLEYILLDEGWAQSTTDPYTARPEMRLADLIAYGRQKNVGIVIWLPWLTVERDWNIFKTYAEWGVKGVKIDFMDHSDQIMVNFYKRVAQEAAKHHLLVDMHGSFTPAGLEQEYPNLLSYEGVRGMEQMGGCRPENSIYLPFIRNAAGPMDFTPGAMNNYQPNQYKADRPNSGAIGTRAYQLALYVVFESALQMLADNPTLYLNNEESTRFIASVPTTWDETRALSAKAGEYLVVAKRKGNKWYIGAINNASEERTIDINLDFLGGQTRQMTAFVDGINADYQAMHYNKVKQEVNASSSVTIKMVKNGGWAAVIE